MELEGRQPPAELWNIICHLESHKLIVITLQITTSSKSSLISFWRDRCDFLERGECVMKQNWLLSGVAKVRNTLVLPLLLISSNSKQIVALLNHYGTQFLGFIFCFWVPQTKYMDKMQRRIGMVALCWKNTGGAHLYSLYWKSWTRPAFSSICEKNGWLTKWISMLICINVLVLSPVNENSATITSYKEYQKNLKNPEL